MQINMSVQPGHDWTQPLGLLSDCHRRVEKFLGIIAQAAAGLNGGALDAGSREALAKALTYFRQAAPMHTADEEESLFPRLRAADTDEARAALAQVDGLEDDHRTADWQHAEVDALGNCWLAEGTLREDDARRLTELSLGLQEHYRGHIALEDTVIFPLAGRAIPERELLEVGREMAIRRGLDPDARTPESRCVSRRQGVAIRV
ncbi:MAG TPA: hemerythrin domain-containing protein [Armatimonadota bacterium]|jgi:hemerythrin-like domain-containing protein